MDMKNKKVLVFGSGISGIGAGKLLEQVGASVVLYDGKETLDKEVLKAQLGDDTKAEIILGELSEEVMETLDLVVMSPGVPTDLVVLRCVIWEFRSGERSSLPIHMEKAMCLQSQEPMERRRRLHFWERL